MKECCGFSVTGWIHPGAHPHTVPSTTPAPRSSWSWLALLGLLAPALAAGEPVTTKQALVSGLGRLEPAGGIVHVAAPYSIQGPSILSELLVRDGESVTNAQPLARTHTHAASHAAWRHAQQLVAAARARLAQAEAGAKPAEIAMLAAEAERDGADFTEAQRDLGRMQRLRQDGAISQQSFDEAGTRLLTRSNILVAATRRLAAGREVRTEDVAVARAEVAVAEAQAERAREEWNQTLILAPQSGQILAVHARLGEEVGPGGLLDLGHTDQMNVKMEVYETDIRHVRVDQRVEVTGEAFAQTLTGRVEKIGRQVRPNRLLKPDPSEFADARIVEVTIRLENATGVAGLSGALVNVRILP